MEITEVCHDNNLPLTPVVSPFLSGLSYLYSSSIFVFIEAEMN
jgi:hypothetical protein